jgi:hypothetical protein
LAYHYTVLPLRHLIVAADPLSITSPASILDKYRSIGMTIELRTGNQYWYDARGLPKASILAFDPLNHTDKESFHLHTKRQNVFYTQCLKRFREIVPNVT